MSNSYKYNRNSKILEKEEEYDLIRSWQNNKDNKALNKLLASYKRLVVSYAKKFSSYGLPIEDLIQEGTMGLMYAVERFDIEKGFRLSTYSQWWVRAMIQDYIIKNWSVVKNGTTASQKILFFSFNKIKKLINFDSLKTMDLENVEKISKMLNIKSLDVEHLTTRLKMGDQSLNSTIKEGESNVELISLLKDDSPTQEDVYANNKDNNSKRKWILESIKKLNKRERYIINSRKLEEKPKTLKEISKQLKISKERVRQIEVISLKKLKKNILEISNETQDFFIN